MKGIRISLRVKVTVLILVLITVVIGAFSYYTLQDKSASLRANVIDSATREINSLAFLSARAILAEDDFAVADSIANVRSLQGFVYAAVFSANANALIGEAVEEGRKGNALDATRSLMETGRRDLQQSKNEGEVSEWRKAVSVQDKDDPGLKSARLFVVQKKIFHPFVVENPPLLGVAQFAFSDKFIREELRRSQIEIILGTVIFLLVGIAGAFGLSTVITRPVKVLSRSAQIVGGGDLDHAVPDLGSDELGMLAKQFNEMTKGLRLAQMERANQAVVTEQIRQAQEIQQGMNPAKFLKKDKFQIKGFTRAAKGVGGDYYDFQILKDGRLAVLLSDVSGKGVSASLVMVLIKTVVSSYLRFFDRVRPDAIVSAINRVMCGESHIDKFATIQFMVFNPEDYTLEFCNGGHGPLFLYRAAHNVCTVTKLDGLPMGIEESNTYQLTRVQLQPGDIVALFSDGITESWNFRKDEYGLTRLRDKIVELHEETSKDIVSKIIEDIDAFAGDAEQHDDMTLVVLKIL